MECYLAFTAAEIACCDKLPAKIAWMACHFSPYATGLSNLPAALPPGSLLILNDRTPIHGHDPKRIADALQKAVEDLHLYGILLDFQAQNNYDLQALADYLVEVLPCPVAVSEAYAQGSDCIVFLSPPPVNMPLAEYLAPWKGRTVWLEAAMLTQRFTVTVDGCQVQTLSTAPDDLPLADAALHCHYSIQKTDRAMVFTMTRTKDDLLEHLQEAESLGIQTAVGLYQELSREDTFFAGIRSGSAQ